MIRKLILGTVALLTFGAGASQAGYLPPWYQERYYERTATGWVKLYLNRRPSEREVLLLTNQLRSGITHEAAQANILASDEYLRRSGGTVQGFLRNIFNDVLGRNPTVYEVGVLTARLNQMGRYNFAYQFLVANRGITVGSPY